MRIPFVLALCCVLQNNFAQNYQYYFGNLHAHTGFSDGNKDSLSTGVSVPATSYAYAKLSDNFDFLGISEHNHFSNYKNPGFKRAYYQTGLNMADAANQDGIFPCLFGMEYGVSSTYNGHVLVYGFDQLIGWEHSTPGDTSANYDLYNNKTDYDGLFRKIKNKPNAFAYLAHPDFSDFTTDGTYETALANAPYNAAFDSAIVGMPLRSGIATSNHSNYNDYSTGNYFNYYKKMLYQGYHLGIGYDHDNHYTNFGRGNAGRLVVLAPTLSRAAIVDAMKNMRFYGSDDPNARIVFTLNNLVMGSIAAGGNFPTLQLLHNDADGEHADTMRIWKGYKESGGLWAWTIKSTVASDVLVYTDYSLEPEREYYYFGEIRQKDGQWIVTSPIWYRYQPSTAIKDSLELLSWFEVFPNPVNDLLSISCSAGKFNIQLKDVMGRCIYASADVSGSISIETASLPTGFYLLQVVSENKKALRKICVVH